MERHDMNEHQRSAVVDLVERDLGRPVRSLRPLGRGTAHTAYEIDGAFVARLATGQATDPGVMEREARLLDLVAAVSPVAVPTVVAMDAAAGVTIVTKLPGTSLLDQPTPDPHRVGGHVAGLLDALSTLPDAEVSAVVGSDDDAPAARLDEATAIYSRVADALDAGQRRQIERFLAAPAPAPTTARRLCHNDLGAEHLLAAEDRVTLTGVIDWSDAALADPAADLGRLYRDLGPPTATAIAEHLALDGATLARAAFYARCSLLEDLEYGLTTGDRRYCDAALAHLPRTFRSRDP